MPPRARYNAETILEGALALVQTQGIAPLSARSLAAHLGCSTGPVFTHFASMEALQEALMERIMGRFVERAAQRHHGDPLWSAGLGWLRFAVEEPRLYEALFLRPHPWHPKWGTVRRQLAQRMGQHPRYAHLEPSARFGLVGRVSIVMHGLGVEIWSGRLPRRDPEVWLQQLVEPVIEAALTQGWVGDLHSPQKPGTQERS
jgi:AcrR family transcriptional regulator